MSVISRMVCTQVLLRRKEKGDQAEPRPDRVLRLGELRLPERRGRLVTLNLSAGVAVVKTRLGASKRKRKDQRERARQELTSRLAAFLSATRRIGCGSGS